MMTAMAIAMAMTERLRIYLLFERTFFFDIIGAKDTVLNVT